MATPTPALPPPPGQTSNFENPPSLTKSMDIAMGVALPLTCTLFGLRMYVRLFVKKTWTIEDWLAFIAWIGTVSFCGVGRGTMAHHGGRHGWDITAAQAHEASYWFNVASIHYGITICIAKLAVLWLYRRVFSPHRGSPFDISIVSMIVLLILFYTAINLVKIWECVPRAKIFNPKIPGSCINTPMLLNVSGIFNTVTDLMILLLPVKAVWKMNMKIKKKVTVVLVFTFGLCGPAFSLVGTIVRIQGSSNPDKTWVQPDIIMWGLAELTTGILCVSLPELGHLWAKKKQSVPTASILNGTYRREDALYHGKRGLGFSTIASHKGSRQNNSLYYELDEADYGRGTQECHDVNIRHQRPGEVSVTSEVIVDSRLADNIV